MACEVPTNADGRRIWLLWSMLALLALVAIGTVASTHRIFSPTWDEPAHIATGLELLEHGRYELEPLHPPLARLAAAIGPAALGARLTDAGELWQSARHTLYSHPRHQELVVAARRGTLIFLALTILATALWAHSLAGPWAALLAGGLLVTTPPILAHAGLATTDMAATGTIILSLWCFVRWLERPSVGRGGFFGLAVGLAVMSKYSAVPFLGLAFVLIALVRLAARAQPSKAAQDAHRRPMTVGVLAAALTFVAVLWLSHAPGLAVAWQPTSASPSPAGVSAEGERDQAPVFLRSIAAGLTEAIEKNRAGHAGYFLGTFGGHSSLLFFPVALAVKTPLPLLLLGLFGLLWAGRRLWTQRDWRAAAPAVAFLAILLLAVTSQINIGLRHVLVLYPLMAIIAAAAVSRVLSPMTRIKPVALALLLALLGGQAVEVVRAHPDHLAYFNPLAGDTPERILIGGDLDWGQDLHRLARALDGQGIACLGLLYAGSADPAHYGLPPLHKFDPRREQPSGWVAVSLLERERYRPYLAWMLEEAPRFRAGVSIDVYYIDRADARDGCLSSANATG